jgi:hypothetical protein
MNSKRQIEPALASDLHSTPANKNIGFPGWPEHNLDCVLVLGGQLTKGACTGPLFFILMTAVGLCIHHDPWWPAATASVSSKHRIFRDLANPTPTVLLSNSVYLSGCKTS